MEKFIAPAVLDLQVRSLLAARPTSPTRQVLAVLAWGLDADRAVPPRLLRSSLRRVTTLGPPVENIAVWRSLVTQARRHAREQGLASTRERDALRVARSLLGRLVCEPVEARPAAALAARQVAAAIGVEILAQLGPDGNGWTGAIVSYDSLGARLSMSNKSAEAAVRLAIEKRWLVRLSGGRGTPGRYRLASTLPGPLGEKVDGELYEAVEALAQRSTDDVLSALMLSVEHPGWAALGGPRAWAVAMATAAGVEPAVLGIPVRAARSALKGLAQAGLNPATWTGDLVQEVLDRVADQPGEGGGPSAREVREAEVLAQRERAAARALQVQEFAAARQAERDDKKKARADAREAAIAETVQEEQALPDRIEVDLPAGWTVEADAAGLKSAWAAKNYAVKGIRRGPDGEPTVAVVVREAAAA